jgi:hypothetical protein
MEISDISLMKSHFLVRAHKRTPIFQSRQSGVLPGTIEVLIQMLRSAEGRPARSELKL